MGPGQLLFLADGRLFVRRDDGTIGEADEAERDYADFILDYLEAVPMHPRHGLAMAPPTDS